MNKMPFELYGRQLVDGGVRLLFRCAACGADSTLILKDDDALDQKYPVACACGVEVNMYFGSPLVGKALVRSLKRIKEPGDTLHRCQSPLLN